ncbi:hypothetical protein I3F58_02765 [Streptomyces sp. MUM 203J]|nr:hypothetical protein [Streptomyces sp. MUM 203J]MCH0538498.1 hypothetical protein [Streptomyces sp. MUM 203J]
MYIALTLSSIAPQNGAPPGIEPTNATSAASSSINPAVIRLGTLRSTK